MSTGGTVSLRADSHSTDLLLTFNKYSSLGRVIDGDGFFSWCVRRLKINFLAHGQFLVSFGVKAP